MTRLFDELAVVLRPPRRKARRPGPNRFWFGLLIALTLFWWGFIAWLT